tara:strand:- start:11157 stop:12227 length:1071 start_codon:yes stop_codon:yes gene_type:complete
MAFGQAKEDKKLPTSQRILECISQLDIFEMYLGGLPRKAISSPLREDTDPSFSLFHSDKYNKVLYKDFASGDVGDCFTFVMRLFQFGRITDAFNKIAMDFRLDHLEHNGFVNALPSRKKINKRKERKLINKKMRIAVTVRPWKIRDKNYWEGRYGFTKDQLEYCKIFPISHFFVNGNCTVAQDLAYAFVEEKDGVQTFKIYQPFADKDNKWTNNNDFSTWELWTQMPAKGQNLIITSSRKDALMIKSLFPSDFITACSLQSEGVNAKESVVNELKGRFKEIFVMYDNDFDNAKNPGRNAGQKLCDKTGFLQIEIPDGCEVKDPSDYAHVFNREDLRNLILRLIKERLRQEELKQIQ